jgi:predicted SAM-dependent methyltransferase
MKLNLGCGDDFRRGWLNVDCRRLYPEGDDFLCCDLLALDGRLQDGCAEEIAAWDVLEYLPWREVDAVLVMLGKKLRPGGLLTLRVPDLEWAARDYAAGAIGHHEAQRRLYGGQGYPEDTYRSLWSRAEVERRLAMIGLAVERLEDQGDRIAAWARRPS